MKTGLIKRTKLERHFRQVHAFENVRVRKRCGGARRTQFSEPKEDDLIGLAEFEDLVPLTLLAFGLLTFFKRQANLKLPSYLGRTQETNNLELERRHKKGAKFKV